MKKWISLLCLFGLILGLCGCTQMLQVSNTAPIKWEKVQSVLFEDLDTVAETLGYTADDFVYDKNLAVYKLKEPVLYQQKEFSLKLHFRENKAGKGFLGCTLQYALPCKAPDAAQIAIELRDALTNYYGPADRTTKLLSSSTLSEADADTLVAHFSAYQNNAANQCWELQTPVENIPEELKGVYGSGCFNLWYRVYHQSDYLETQFVYVLGYGAP